MKSRNFINSLKNAMGTVFLLAGAFFVCSTLISIRAVFADPVAPVVYVETSGRPSPRATNSARANASNTVRRTTTASGRSARANASRAVAARTAATPRTVQNTSATASRAATRNVVTNTSNATPRGALSNAATRRVVSRTGTASPRTTRNVVARTAVAPATASAGARVSLQGAAIRGSGRGNGTSAYTYMNSKLYNSADMSNIIDSQTGLISANAYSNCLESYYTCMDEICTARNEAQGRCSCAARTRAFRDAEDALEKANEELITVSGELALLVATKGKDVSKAFQLTDAERIMNCAAYAEMVADIKTNAAEDEDITKWCAEHPEYVQSGSGIEIVECSKTKAPTYCETMGEQYSFKLEDLGGSGSDILASLRSWANAKDAAKGMLVNDDNSLSAAFMNQMDIVSGMDLSILNNDSATSELDNLANTWGYDLFEYAHNNVCSRVLDSCFNGIYEACGTPPSPGRCATSATTSCPYNYNSMIEVSSVGDVELIDRSKNNAHSSTTNASCFGYSTTDPYEQLRGPVADARRSIMQKYLLDANAACDVYGEQLRTMAQNVGYQKVAAQQALQQKRLEFAQEETEETLNAAIEAGTNFDNCISEIYECYEKQVSSHGDEWTNTRIRTYCSQIANVPSCYEPMVCNPSNAVFKAVIDKPDSASCKNSVDYKNNTCRNIVTLNDILNGTGGNPADATDCEYGEGATCDSAAVRQKCLLDAIGVGSGESGAYSETTKNAIQTWLDDNNVKTEDEK